MEKVFIQINHEKAYKLLDELEKQNLIQILNRRSFSKGKLSEKYAGKISSQAAERLQVYVAKSRDEWPNSIT